MTVKQQNKRYEREFFNRAGTGNDAAQEGGCVEEVFRAIDEKIADLRGCMLEAGCGSGAYGKRLLARYPELRVIGADIAAARVDNANDGTPRYQAVEGDLEEEALFQPKTFDHLLCPFILHHFPDISRVVANFSAWLKPGGYAIVIEPNGNNIINRISKALRRIVEFCFGADYVVRKGYATPNETDHLTKTYRAQFERNGFCFIALEAFFDPGPEGGSLLTLSGVKSKLYRMMRSLFPRATWSGNGVVMIFRRADGHQARRGPGNGGES